MDKSYYKKSVNLYSDVFATYLDFFGIKQAEVFKALSLSGQSTVSDWCTRYAPRHDDNYKDIQKYILDYLKTNNSIRLTNKDDFVSLIKERILEVYDVPYLSTILSDKIEYLELIQNILMFAKQQKKAMKKTGLSVLDDEVAATIDNNANTIEWTRSSNIVLTEFNDIVDKKLSKFFVNFPYISKEKVYFLNILKNMPRTGKISRLNALNAKHPFVARTVFDHMVSLTYLADVLLSLIKVEIDETELAKMIAFHELCECFLGDIPKYTTLEYKEDEKRVNEKVLEKSSHAKREFLSNQFIALFVQNIQLQTDLNDVNMKFFPQVTQINDTVKIFNLLDDCDCIIAIWRYIQYYYFTSKKAMLTDINQFINIMKDFFNYPKVQAYGISQTYITGYSLGSDDEILPFNDRNISDAIISRFAPFISFLMNQRNAYEYVRGEKDIPKQFGQLFQYLIHDVPLFC